MIKNEMRRKFRVAFFVIIGLIIIGIGFYFYNINNKEKINENIAGNEEKLREIESAISGVEKQLSEQPKESAGIGDIDTEMGELCRSEEECIAFCSANLQKCLDFCKNNPEKIACKMMQNNEIISDTDGNKEIKPFVKHNFIELDRIEKISKFRSGYGHDYSYESDEDCRSMKHYYWAFGGDPRAVHNPLWISIKYYAPVNGTIKRLSTSQTPYGTEMRFNIQSDEEPSIYFAFFHVKLNENFKEGSRVYAGQEIGTVGSEDAHGEVAVEQIINGRVVRYYSFFELIEDNVFERYRKRGASSREQLIITKEERDAKPLLCGDTWEQRFMGRKNVSESLDSFRQWQIGSDNWVLLR